MSSGTLERPLAKAPWRSDLGWLVASLALHLLLLGMLVRTAGLDPRAFFHPSPPPGVNAKAKAQTSAAPSDADTLIEVRPFEGVSWETYTKRKADRSHQESTANAVLAKLKGLKFGSGAGSTAPPAANAPSAGAAPIDVGGGGSGPSLGALVARQEYAVRHAEVATAPGVRKMTEAERAELKKRFHDLERQFRKAFAQALNDDPDLRLTIAFEAEVQKNGALAVRTFRPKGRYRPESLEKIQSAMRHGIGDVVLSPDLAGTRLRGESVFVK